MKEKKQLTPKQQVRRFYFAAGFIAVLILICVVPTRINEKVQDKDTEEEIYDPIKAGMDSLLTVTPLDSICGGKTSVEQTKRWWKELVTDPNVEEIEMLRKIIGETDSENEWSKKIKEEMSKKLDSLQRARLNPNDKLYYARWIRVKAVNDEGEQEYNLLQYCDTLLTESRIYIKAKIDNEPKEIHENPEAK